MNYAQPKPPVRRIGGIAFVVGLHAVIVYALLTGLATKVVDVIRQPIETRIIEEIKPPPPPTPTAEAHRTAAAEARRAPAAVRAAPGSARRCTAFAKRDRRAVDHARAVGPRRAARAARRCGAGVDERRRGVSQLDAGPRRHSLSA